AVSIEAFPGAETASRQNTALLLLAAGASSRFVGGDKLLAELDGKPVLAHAASHTVSPPSLQRVAVTPTDNSPRERELEAKSWQIVRNAKSTEGQASSLVCGLELIASNPDIDQIILLLGDMPFVPNDHLSQMLKLAEQNRVTAIMSECDGILCPPALFKRTHFDNLSNLTGDRGARSVFAALRSGGVTLPLAAEHGRDIDLVADLEAASEMTNA
ncbi:MAG: nucleotidyltransferase family protein, partial [Pseudomonadota bacterium]